MSQSWHGRERRCATLREGRRLEWVTTGCSDLFFYVLLTVHLSITLVNDQLDAQFFYFIIRLLRYSTCFEQRRAHHQEVKLY